MKLPWLLWQDLTHGPILRARYHTTYRKDADDELGAGDVCGFEQGDGEQHDDDDEDYTPTTVQSMNNKYELALAYYEELDEEEQKKIQERRENDWKERREAYQKSLRGETACNGAELAE